MRATNVNADTISLVGKENTDRYTWINPTNELAISPVYRLVGTTFIGDTIDANFWDGTTGLVNNGTAAQTDGVLTLTTSATSEGAAKVISKRKGRFVAGSALLLGGAVNWVTAGTASNVRRVGAFTATDGYFFQLNGTTFSIGTRIDSTDTLVDSGSFNGNYGPSWTPTTGTCYKINIEYLPIGVLYYIDGKLLHKIGKTPSLSATLTLPITIENTNGAITTDVTFNCVGLYIARQGELITNPTYKHISTDTTTVCKLGAGVLHSIAINNPGVECTLTIYDNTSAAAPVIGIILMTTKVITPWVMAYNLPFSNGLTIVTSAANDFTIIYE